jgi:hypothetical protein
MAILLWSGRLSTSHSKGDAVLCSVAVRSARQARRRPRTGVSGSSSDSNELRDVKQGLHSGLGNGKYRHYEAVPGGDWQLKIEADFVAQFDGRKYHVDFTFDKDEILKLDSKRMFYDGEKITVAEFTPRAHPTGAQAHVSTPNDYGDGLGRGAWGDFQWDVTNLAQNVWDPERLVKNLGANRVEIKQTPDGDLIGSYPLTNTDRVRVRFECPRKFGYNLAKLEVFNVGKDHPAQEFSLQWRQGATGLWYVTSLLETFQTRDEQGKLDRRLRGVMMYSRFEPNAKVDPSLFTEESLHLPAGSPIVDSRPEAKVRYRRSR